MTNLPPEPAPSATGADLPSRQTLSAALLQHIEQLAEAVGPRGLPPVQALHLPPVPAADGLRGEFTALELADGTLGLGYVLLGQAWQDLSRRQASAQPAVCPGDDALNLARGLLSPDPLRRTVGLAAVNALTRWLFDRAGLVPPASTDSVGGLSPQPGETIGMVGHFTPLIPRLTAAGARVRVIELRPDWVGERDGVRVTLDPSELAGCQKVLLTGTVVMNGTLEGLLQHTRGARQRVLIGPSVGGPPDPLFACGLTRLGGTWVLDGPACVQALRAGCSFGPATRKFALDAADYPGWPALLARLAD